MRKSRNVRMLQRQSQRCWNVLYFTNVHPSPVSKVQHNLEGTPNSSLLPLGPGLGGTATGLCRGWFCAWASVFWKPRSPENKEILLDWGNFQEAKALQTDPRKRASGSALPTGAEQTSSKSGQSGTCIAQALRRHVLRRVLSIPSQADSWKSSLCTKKSLKTRERWLFFKSPSPRITRNMKRQENMVPPKEQDQLPENDATKMEIFELLDKIQNNLLTVPGGPGVRTQHCHWQVPDSTLVGSV